uniref:DNA-binding domain-containing protein, AraC-type n=1 Tax=Desulfovibrio sp. U5L TaxID=596152 RepID=I2Q3E2_9BACT
MEHPDLLRPKSRMAALLAGLAARDGFTPTRLPDVQVVRNSQPFARRPVVYSPGIVIVGQGIKRGYVGDAVHTYDPDHYFVTSVLLPFECEVVAASPEAPLLALSINVDRALLGELLLEIGDTQPAEASASCGAYSTPLTRHLRGAALRLLECLAEERDSRILGPQIVREIIYRVLLEEPGGTLRALAGGHGGFDQIAKALRRIHAEYDQPLVVDALARTAGMSASVFYQHFKTITATTPLQYLKSIRLHKARLLMAQDGLTAGAAAGLVGYASPSQFGREFKRFFGASPVEEAARMRSRGLPGDRQDEGKSVPKDAAPPMAGTG